jgi:malonyl-CoA/methylmalonyl-CoA synthetase
MSASRLIARWLARADERRPAVQQASRTATWHEVVDAADRVAAALLGGRESLAGERIALLVSPGASFVACLFGVLRAGGVVVVLSPLHPPPETSYFCDDAGVRTVVASADLVDRVAFLAPERRIVLSGDLVRGARASIRADPDEGDAAIQLYTSGTTGKPKGAILTHANLAVQQELLGEAWALSQDDVLLHVLPLHHLHGLAVALLSATGIGATTRFLQRPSFDARGTWDDLARSSVLMAVPTIHAKLFAAFDHADEVTRARWSNHARLLRLVTSGSAALPIAIGNRWRELTGAYPLERYGMTEIGIGVSNPLAPEGRRPGTVGMPLRTVKVRIVGDNGRDSDAGELWVAGPSVFAGYHERRDATRDAFRVDDDGERWFKTGDTVSLEKDYVRVLGRTSVDIIKSGGYKLSALEIEEALREHPAVAEIAVIGIPDATWGERVVACVVAREGHADECSEERLRAFTRERLAPYKVPRQVVVMRELPCNALGKVLKSELVKRLG